LSEGLGWRTRALLSLIAAAAASVIFGIAVVGTANATSMVITITSGTCSGGGTSYCFNPEGSTVQIGAHVSFVDHSGVAHEVVSCTPSACPGSPPSTGPQHFDVSLPANGQGSLTFTSAGTYYYYCSLHGYAAMHGRITVTTPATPPPSPSATPVPTARPTPKPTDIPATKSPSNAPVPRPTATSAPPVIGGVASSAAPASPSAAGPTIVATPAISGTPSRGVGAAINDVSSAIPIAVAVVVLLAVAATAGYIALRRGKRPTG
jgi:plastocyanin